MSLSISKQNILFPLKEEVLVDSPDRPRTISLPKVANPFEAIPFKDMVTAVARPPTYRIGSFYRVKTPTSPTISPKEVFKAVFAPEEFLDTDLVVVPRSKKDLALNEIYEVDAYLWAGTLEQIREGKTCLQIEGDEFFKATVNFYLKILITRPTGRKLLQAILSLDKPLYFVKDSVNKTTISFENGKLVLRVFLTGNERTFYFICAVDGEPRLIETPYVTIVAHELIHVLQNSSYSIPDLKVLSGCASYRPVIEEFTIAGVEGHDGLPSENAIRAEFGLPMRLAHFTSGFPPFDPLIHNPRATIGGYRWLAQSVYLGLTVEVAKLLKAGLPPTEATDIPIKHNSGEMLGLLVKGSVDPISQSVKKDLLHAVVVHSANACIDPLMEIGTPVDVKDSSGRTPLHRAVMNGDYKTAEDLLTYGADVEALAPLHKTSLALAVDRRDLKMVQILLKYGARVSRSAENALELLRTRTSSGPVSEQKFLWSFCCAVRREFAIARSMPKSPIKLR